MRWPSTFWSRIAVGGVLTLLLLVGAAYYVLRTLGTLGRPTIGILVSGSGSMARFTFRHCRARDEPVLVARVSLFSKGSEVCRLEAKNSSLFLGNAWTYGETPVGFSRKGCEPLELGGRYRVDVMGFGIGYQDILVTPAGRLELTGEGICGP